MFYFSKSKYTAFRACPKLCWLRKYKPEEQKTDSSAQALFDRGHEIGDLAKTLFGDFVETTTYRQDGSLDISAMIEKTKRLLADGAENICEAAFNFNGLYCAVDILHREGDGYAIYEVKSSSAIKERYFVDVAYQKYVVEHCGVKLVGAHVIILNKGYIKNGEIDVKQLFLIDGGEDISKQIAAEEKFIEDNLAYAEQVMASLDEPNIDIGYQCDTNCDYWQYCARNLPKPSVLDLYYCNKKWVLYNSGIVSFDDVLKSGVKLNEIQRRQVEFALEDKGIYADKAEINKFLSSLTYPLYFLDFETFAQAVPEIDGTRPYQPIPFQYSLHYVESQTGEAKHSEFLGVSGTDPRRELAESLVKDIPQNACTLAFHASTERGIIQKLANIFPDLKEKLENIADGVKDLYPVFKNNYYKREIGGSFSIKSILPAICPDMNYGNLEGVHKGNEASDIFPKIKDMPPEEAEKTRQALLVYCKLDTLAMVILWQELLRVSK